jgi:TRAP-type C4-dicarboxylate transport system permease small subunit
MRVKDEKLSNKLRSDVTRILNSVTLFPTALLVAISWITAGAVLLTHSQVEDISANSAAVVKLLGGAALLFLSGIYFMQQLAGRQIRNQADILYERNASAFASMKKAIDAHIEKQSEAASQGDRPER